MILYCGLGMMAMGMVFTVVGLGELQLELQLVGPVIFMCGGVLACVRILLCVVPHCGCGGRGSQRDDVETLLNRENKFKDQRDKIAFMRRPETALTLFERREVVVKEGLGQKTGGWGMW